MTKTPLSSKTIIFNIVSILALVINQVMEIFTLTPGTLEVLSMVMIGVNLILRFVSDKPIFPGIVANVATRSTEPKQAKWFFLSGTVWLNVISLIVVVANQSMENGFVPDSWDPYLILVIGVLNAVSRFFVNQPIVPSLK